MFDTFIFESCRLNKDKQLLFVTRLFIECLRVFYVNKLEDEKFLDIVVDDPVWRVRCDSNRGSSLNTVLRTLAQSSLSSCVGL